METLDIATDLYVDERYSRSRNVESQFYTNVAS